MTPVSDLADRLTAATAAERVEAMAELGQGAEPPTAPELDALRECLGDERKLVQRRAAETFAALARRGRRVEQVLHTAVAADEWRLRWGATHALFQIGRLPPRALDTLIEVTGSADGDLRWAAAGILIRFAAEQREVVASRLIEAAHRGNPNQRKMALYCLRDIKVCDVASQNAAQRALDDDDIAVRLAGLSALVRVATDVRFVSQQIAALIDDPDHRMQRAAAGTLGSLGHRSSEVLDALDRAGLSSDRSLRRAAEHSLRALVPDGKPGLSNED